MTIARNLGFGVLLFVSAASVAAAPAPTADANPADLHKQAFALLAKIERPEERKFFGDDPPPMDEATGQFLQQHAPAMDLLRQAAAVNKPADWGDPQGDLRTLTQYRRPAQTALYLATLRSNFDLAKGNAAEAVDDLLAGVAMARQLAHQKLLVSRMNAASLESDATDRVARLLFQLPPDAAKQLAAKWKSLPPPPSGKQTMEASAAFLKLAPDPKLTPAQREQAVAFHANLADAFDLPPEKFVERVKAEAAKAADNALVQQMAQALPGTHEIIAAAHAKHAMLPVAIEVKLRGPDAAKTSKDPFGAGAFKVEPLDGGAFRVVSAATQRGRPVTLEVSLPNR